MRRTSRTIVTLGAVMTWSALAAAEDAADALRKGRIELSTAAAFERADADGDTVTTVSLPTRLGYFATDRLELEGELGLTHISPDGEGQTGVRGSGSLLYHFGKERVRPFVIAGAGIGTGAEYLGLVADSDRTVTSFHGGAGLKALVGERAAFRVEYRFVRFTASADRFESSEHSNNHRLFTGISLFFR